MTPFALLPFRRTGGGLPCSSTLPSSRRSLTCSRAGVDRLGVYLYVQRLGQAGEVVRVAFLRPVADERDARSSLTLMAQLAWERERNYVPVRASRSFIPTIGSPSHLSSVLFTGSPCRH